MVELSSIDLTCLIPEEPRVLVASGYYADTYEATLVCPSAKTKKIVIKMLRANVKKNTKFHKVWRLVLLLFITSTQSVTPISGFLQGSMHME